MKFSCDNVEHDIPLLIRRWKKRLRIRCKVCNFIMDVRGTPRHLIQADVSRSETKVQAAPDLPADQDWYVTVKTSHQAITFGALAGEIKSRRLARDVLVWNETFSTGKRHQTCLNSRDCCHRQSQCRHRPRHPELGDEYPVDQRGVAPTAAPPPSPPSMGKHFTRRGGIRSCD